MPAAGIKLLLQNATTSLKSGLYNSYPARLSAWLAGFQIPILQTGISGEIVILLLPHPRLHMRCYRCRNRPKSLW